jgi:hypothetical protein
MTEIIALLDKYGVAVGVLVCLLYAMGRFATWASGHVDAVVRAHLGLIDALRKESEERIVQGMQSSEALHQIATLNASHLPKLDKLTGIEKGLADHQIWSEKAVEVLKNQQRP